MHGREIGPNVLQLSIHGRASCKNCNSSCHTNQVQSHLNQRNVCWPPKKIGKCLGQKTIWILFFLSFCFVIFKEIKIIFIFQQLGTVVNAKSNKLQVTRSNPLSSLGKPNAMPSHLSPKGQNNFHFKTHNFLSKSIILIIFFYIY